MLANIYLHYSLDLWFTRRFIKTCEGRACLIRYADDFVVCFQRVGDAKRFREELDGRLGKFGLEVAAEKTKILEFGPLAKLKANARGEKVQTFEFLGLTHYCSRTRNGSRFRMNFRNMFPLDLQAFRFRRSTLLLIIPISQNLLTRKFSKVS